jgi:hypothetical protein
MIIKNFPITNRKEITGQPFFLFSVRNNIKHAEERH